MSYTLVLEWMPGDLYMSAVTARCTAPTSSYSVVWLPPNKVYQITLYCGSTSLVSFLVGAFRGKAWSYMNNFTFEEINLMCIYNSGDGTRQELIEALTEMRGYLGADETELLELTDSALAKLSAMTDEAFAELELYPDFDSEDNAYDE